MNSKLGEAVRWNCLEQRVCSGQQPQSALGIVVLHKLADDPDEEARRVEAILACQRKGSDERLVQMVADASKSEIRLARWAASSCSSANTSGPADG